MRIGSLCSGYGGLDRAVEELTGGEVVWVSDIDKGANKILAHRYPDVPNLGDFTKVDWLPTCPVCGDEQTLTISRGEDGGATGYFCAGPDSCTCWFSFADVVDQGRPEPIEMLTAGYPCQPFSHAGKRAGTNDARHLWPEVLRCLTTLRPPFALFENVRGHLSLGFDQVLADLASHDYDARWIVLRAADIGAPHGRARLFILASDARRGGDRWDLVGAGRGSVRVGGVRGEDPDGGADAGGADLLGGKLMPTPRASDGEKGGPNQRGSSGDLMLPSAVAQLLPTPVASEGTKPSNTMGVERRKATGEVFLTNAIVTLCGLDPTETPTLLPTPAVNDMGAAYTPDEWDAWTERMKAEHGNGNGHGKSLSIEAQRLLPTPMAYVRGDDTVWMPERPEQLHMAPNDGGTPWLDSAAAYVSEHGEWGDYAPAIHRWEQILGRPAPAPTMTSAKGNPQLAPRFVEWMMGLPEGWVDDVPNLTRNEKLKALGNGVVWQQAAEAVRRLLAIGGAA